MAPTGALLVWPNSGLNVAAALSAFEPFRIRDASPRPTIARCSERGRSCTALPIPGKREEPGKSAIERLAPIFEASDG
jgi:hypothetical protein